MMDKDKCKIDNTHVINVCVCVHVCVGYMLLHVCMYKHCEDGVHVHVF